MRIVQLSFQLVSKQVPKWEKLINEKQCPCKQLCLNELNHSLLLLNKRFTFFFSKSEYNMHFGYTCISENINWMLKLVLQLLNSVLHHFINKLSSYNVTMQIYISCASNCSYISVYQLPIRTTGCVIKSRPPLLSIPYILLTFFYW